MTTPLYIFGAGASAFSGGISPTAPPLGNKLFDELCKFDPFFQQLDASLKDAFRCNFEQGMAELSERHNDNLITEFQNRMSLYFLQFAISDPKKNFYSRFVKLITRIPGESFLATLNYDLLLDMALIEGGHASNWKYPIPIKVHGAPNLLVGENLIENFANGNLAHNVHVAGDFPPDAADPEGAKAYCEKCLRYGSVFAPAISFYARGKHVHHNPRLIQKGHVKLAEIIETTNAIVLVGVLLNEEDTHIWGPLSTTSARIGVVNPDPGPYCDWARRKGRDCRMICGTADEMVSTAADQLVTFVRRKLKRGRFT